jgi:hypothetical protein
VRRRRDVLWRSVDGYLAVSTVGGEALAASGPAAAIWELLDDWTTIEELSGQLATRHGADLDEVRSDVAAFVGRLIDGGYAERTDRTVEDCAPDAERHDGTTEDVGADG